MIDFKTWCLEQYSNNCIIGFRGCRKNEDYFNVPDIVTNNPSMDICWSTSSFLNSQFYEDGEIQIIKMNVSRPFIVNEQDCKDMKRQHIIDEIKIFNHFIEKEKLQYDCIVFQDIIDGSHPSNVYALLNDYDSDKIERIATIRYNDEGEMSISIEKEFDFLDIDLQTIDRIDEIKEDNTNQRIDIKKRIEVIKNKYK